MNMMIDTWVVRDSGSYKAIMTLFKDTSVPQSLTRTRLIQVKQEIDNLLLALTDVRTR